MGYLVSCLFGSLVGCFMDWWVGWLGGGLVGCLVA